MDQKESQCGFSILSRACWLYSLSIILTHINGTYFCSCIFEKVIEEGVYYICILCWNALLTSLIHCLDSRFFSVNAHGKRSDVIVYGFEPILPAHKNIWAEYYIIAFPKLPKLNQNWFTRKVGSNSGENVVRKSMLEYRLIRKQVDEVSLIHMVSKMYVIFLCRKRLLVIELLPQPQNLWFSHGVSHCRINCTNFFRETYLNRTSKNTWLQIVKALFLWHICPFRLYHKFAFYLAGRGWELPHVNCVVGCHLYSFALAVWVW